jgi:hypothetical protein
MVSYACDGDELAMLAQTAENQRRMVVTYEDPAQQAERRRLMALLGGGGDLSKPAPRDAQTPGSKAGCSTARPQKRSTRLAGF